MVRRMGLGMWCVVREVLPLPGATCAGVDLPERFLGGWIPTWSHPRTSAAGLGDAPHVAYGTAALRSLSTPRSSWPGPAHWSTRKLSASWPLTPAQGVCAPRALGADPPAPCDRHTALAHSLAARCPPEPPSVCAGSVAPDCAGVKNPPLFPEIPGNFQCMTTDHPWRVRQ
jgi:hypothetical protein